MTDSQDGRCTCWTIVHNVESHHHRRKHPEADSTPLGWKVCRIWRTKSRRGLNSKGNSVSNSLIRTLIISWAYHHSRILKTGELSKSFHFLFLIQIQTQTLTVSVFDPLSNSSLLSSSPSMSEASSMSTAVSTCSTDRALQWPTVFPIPSFSIDTEMKLSNGKKTVWEGWNFDKPHRNEIWYFGKTCRSHV